MNLSGHLGHLGARNAIPCFFANISTFPQKNHHRESLIDLMMVPPGFVTPRVRHISMDVVGNPSLSRTGLAWDGTNIQWILLIFNDWHGLAFFGCALALASFTSTVFVYNHK